MTDRIHAVERGAFVVALALAVVVATPAAVTASPGATAEPTLGTSSERTEVGATATTELSLSEAPDGLSGFNVTIRLANPDTATITDASVPDAFGLREVTVLDGGNAVRLKATDLDDNYTAGDGPVAFAAVTVRGDASGSTELRVDVDQVDDDDVDRVAPGVDAGTLSVEADDGSPTATTTTATETTTGTEPETTTESGTTAEPTESTTTDPTATTATATSATTTGSVTSTTDDGDATTDDGDATTDDGDATTEDDGGSPGFGVPVAVLALLAAALLARRRR